MQLQIRSSNLSLYNEDCFSVLKKIPDKSVQLVVSDPPYAISMKNSHNKNESDWDSFSSEEYIKFLTDWLKECNRILTDNGTVWFFYGFTRIKEVLSSIDNSGFINHLYNHIVYARGKGRGSSKKLKSLREECAHLTKTDDYIWNSETYLRRCIAPYRLAGGEKRGWDYNDQGIEVRYTGLGNVIPIFTSLEKDPGGDNRRGTVLDIGSGERLPLSGDIYNLQFPVVPSVLNKMEKQIHTAQKATMILIMLIMLSSNEGDTVLDCFGGSFSTGVASVITNRNFIGIEREKETFESGVKHLNSAPYDRWDAYVGNHLKSTEKGFKFGIQK